MIGVVIFLVNLCLWLYAKIFSGLFLLRIFCYKSCVKIHVRIKKSSLTLKQEISNFDDFFFKPKLSESRPYLAKFSFSDMGNEFFFSYTIFDTVLWIFFRKKEWRSRVCWIIREGDLQKSFFCVCVSICSSVFCLLYHIILVCMYFGK